MKSEQIAVYGVVVALSGALLTSGLLAQPPMATDVERPLVPPLSLAELEKFIGGRTILRVNLKDATLEEAAVALSQSSGLKIAVRERPVVPVPTGMTVTAPREPLYSLEAKEQPFWEAFLSWQRAALATRQAQPPLPDTVLPDGRIIALRTNTDLGLFALQKTPDSFWLQGGNPLAQGRTLVKWPYVMVGTRLTRTQQGNLDEEGLRPIEENDRRGIFFPPPLKTTNQTAPATPKSVLTEEERWQDGLALNVETYLDPKIKPSNLHCDIEEAIDDQGKDLRASDANIQFSLNNAGYRPYSGGVSSSLSIPIRSQPRMGKRLVKLRGTLRFSIVTNSQHWETTDLDKPTAGTTWRDGTEFMVEFAGLTKTGNGWEAKFKAQGEGQRLKQLWQQWWLDRRGSPLMNNSGVFGGSEFQVQVVDDSGQVFIAAGRGIRAGLRSKQDTKDSTPVRPGDSPLPVDINNMVYNEEVTLGFSPVSNIINGVGASRTATGRATRANMEMGRPVKLIVDLPLERREVVLPFEFTNLPLPPS